MKKNIISRVFAIFAVVAVLFLCASPAFAYGVDFRNGSSLSALIGGTLEIDFYSNDVPPSLGAGQYRVSVGIPQHYPFTTTNNVYYDMAEYVEYWDKALATNPSKVQDYTIDIEMGRWKTSVEGKEAWYARTYLTTFSNLESDEYAYFDKASFVMDSFALPFNEDILKKIFSINCRNPMSINVSCKLAWVDSTGALVTTNYSYRPDFKSAPYRMVHAFFDDGAIESFAQFCNRTGIRAGQPVLFTDFQVDINGTINGSFGTLSELSFQTLTIKSNSVVPGAWWNTRNNPSWFFDQIADDLISGEQPDGPVGEVPEADSTTVWLASAVAGFFDAEIMPGFSFGGVLAVAITISVIGILLKFFGGG